MITDQTVLSRVAARWDNGLFASRWENLIGTWCVKYHAKYRKPPGRHIETLFDRWSEDGGREKDVVSGISTFLSSLNGEYVRQAKAVNPDLTLDLAGDLFNKVRIRNHVEELQGELEGGDVKKAVEMTEKFKRVELGVGVGVEPLKTDAEILAAFAAKQDPLIRYPGALGGLFDDIFERDAFVVFEGPDKVGKSVWLLDVAWKALFEGLNVAFFDVGDMSQNQVLLRFAVRASKRPLKEGLVRYPVALSPDRPPTLDRRRLAFQGPLTGTQAVAAFRKAAGRTKGSLKISCHPNNSITIKGVDAVLAGWSDSGWVPDVVVVDYMDILAPMNGTAETRDQIDATWKLARAVSQTYHCCLIGASQTDAQAYDAKVITKKNFSGSKTKNAHVTAMVGLNQTPKEKDSDITRVNLVVGRDIKVSERKCCYVAGCRPLNRPCILSTFPPGTD